MLQQAKRMYEFVNLSGKINTVLSSERLMNDQVMSRVALSVRQRHRAAAPRPAQHVAVAMAKDVFYVAQDRMTRAQADFKGAMGMSLLIQRTLPPFWLGENGPASFRRAAGFQSDLYPIGELLVGRGYLDTSVVPQNAEFTGPASWLFRFMQFYRRASHHGLAGAVLEKPFLRAADHFESQDKMTAAAACMSAAVLGRTILQAPRLVVCAAACVTEGTTAIIVVSASYAAELVLRALRAALVQTAQLTGLDLHSAIEKVDSGLKIIDPFIAFEIAMNAVQDQREAQDGLMAIDVIDPAQADQANHIIRLRNMQDMRKFMALANETEIDEAQERARVGEIAEEIANSYRRLTSRLPDQHALRFGLRLLKDFIDMQWGEDYFMPPELA